MTGHWGSIIMRQWLEVLRSWLARFPDCVNKKKFRHSLGSVPADQPLVVNEDDL